MVSHIRYESCVICFTELVDDQEAFCSKACGKQDRREKVNTYHCCKEPGCRYEFDGAGPYCEDCKQLHTEFARSKTLLKKRANREAHPKAHKRKLARRRKMNVGK